MIITGVATMASTGRLIDRFRNRVVFPIIHDGEVLGFIGRRHPDLSDIDRTGPKYLNTGETPLFHKGAQLFGVVQDKLFAGIPVIVEGPMDAIAVTLGSRGFYIGVAPLGTSLTDEQAAQLAQLAVHPIVATDADPAGRIAAERDYWLLSWHRPDPLHAPPPEGADPADLLAHKGPTALTRALAAAQPLGLPPGLPLNLARQKGQFLDRTSALPAFDGLASADLSDDTLVLARSGATSWVGFDSAIKNDLGYYMCIINAMDRFREEWASEARPTPGLPSEERFVLDAAIESYAIADQVVVRMGHRILRSGIGRRYLTWIANKFGH
jgi:hypothetical protein